MNKLHRYVFQWLLNKLVNPDVFVQSNIVELYTMINIHTKELYYEDTLPSIHSWLQESFDKAKEKK